MILFKNRRSGNSKSFGLLLFFIIFVSSFNALGYIDSFLEKEEVIGDFKGVVLFSSDGARGVGHLALLMETEDGWFYFSWQSIKVVFSEVPFYALSSLDSFNDWINEHDSLQNYIHDFDSAFYFRGDFSGSVKRAEELFEEFILGEKLSFEENTFSFVNNPSYDVLFNNCVSVSFDVLGESVVNGILVKDFVSSPSFISSIAVKQLKVSLKEGVFFSK